MIANNISLALRIVLVPWLIVTFIQFALHLHFHGRIIPTEDQFGEIGNVSFIIYAIVQIVLFMWILIGWHRFILLDEKPNRFFPKWHGDRMLSYFGRSVVITLFAFPVILAFLIVFWSTDNDLYLTIAGYFIYFIITYCFFRLSLVLPAVAIGDFITLRKSWTSTSKVSLPILILSLVLTAPHTVLQELSWTYYDTVIIGVFLHILFGIQSILSASVLTTLYGYLIEDRQL
jgi:hypothetical protein